VPGAARTSPQPVCASVGVPGENLTAASEAAWRQCREAQTTACHTYVAASQLYLTPESGLRVATMREALSFQSRLSTPGQIIPFTGSLCFEGKKRELLFAISPPISYGWGRVYGLARDLGVSGYPQRMLQGTPSCCCITARTPLFSSFWYQQQL